MNNNLHACCHELDELLSIKKRLENNWDSHRRSLIQRSVLKRLTSVCLPDKPQDIKNMSIDSNSYKHIQKKVYELGEISTYSIIPKGIAHNREMEYIAQCKKCSLCRNFTVSTYFFELYNKQYEPFYGETDEPLSLDEIEGLLKESGM